MNQIEIEHCLQEINKLEKIRENSLNLTKELLSENITQLRNFFIHLTVISVLILAFLLPLLADSNQQVFKTVAFAFLGSIFLVFVPIISTSYLGKVLSRENNNLSKIRNFNEKTLDTAIKLLQKNIVENKDFTSSYKEYLDTLKGFAKDEGELRGVNKKPTKDYMIDILSICFILGIIFIGLSFFNVFGLYLYF